MMGQSFVGDTFMGGECAPIARSRLEDANRRPASWAFRHERWPHDMNLLRRIHRNRRSIVRTAGDFPFVVADAYCRCERLTPAGHGEGNVTQIAGIDMPPR